METLKEKIKMKTATIQYINEIINSYLDDLKMNKENMKDELKEGFIKTLAFALSLIGSLAITLLTANTAFSLPILIIFTPILSASLMGFLVSIIMNISTKKELNKRITESEKIINTAILREEYERNLLQKLEKELSESNDPKQKEDNKLVYIEENPLIKKEIETFAFNTHKIIKVRKSGKLKKFLSERYNVSDKESLAMYEGMVDLYLNNKTSESSTLMPKSRELVRK